MFWGSCKKATPVWSKRYNSENVGSSSPINPRRNSGTEAPVAPVVPLFLGTLFPLRLLAWKGKHPVGPSKKRRWGTNKLGRSQLFIVIRCSAPGFRWILSSALRSMRCYFCLCLNEEDSFAGPKVRPTEPRRPVQSDRANCCSDLCRNQLGEAAGD